MNNVQPLDEEPNSNDLVMKPTPVHSVEDILEVVQFVTNMEFLRFSPRDIQEKAFEFTESYIKDKYKKHFNAYTSWKILKMTAALLKDVAEYKLQQIQEKKEENNDSFK